VLISAGFFLHRILSPQRLEVVRSMYSHANQCFSGDNTLACSLTGVEEITNDEGDDYYVFLLSDANLAQYGVSPKSLADALMADSKVNSYAIFIAGEAEAEAIKRCVTQNMIACVTPKK
jgi:hypothetical protein